MRTIGSLMLGTGLLFLGACGNKPADSQRAASPPATLEKDTLPWVPVKYLLGKFNPGEDSLFVQLADSHTAGNARGTYLRKETYEAYKRMYQAAKDSGVHLVIRSATRNFTYQKSIWEGKWSGQRKVNGQDLSHSQPEPAKRAEVILRYSSMPGTSRHHWGTDLDLNAFDNKYFLTGKGLKEYEWLQAHASTYGFCQPYSPKGSARPFGYEEEKWHWSYLPLAKHYLRSYAHYVSLDSIKGFQGAEAAAELDVINRYVMGIDETCLLD